MSNYATVILETTIIVNLMLLSTLNYHFYTSFAQLETEHLEKGKVHPCTGTEALYRPYGP